VTTATDGQSGLERARSLKPDLIVLDVMLPKLSGLEVCKTLRGEGYEGPILMLTARGQEIDKVVGLELGADDYVTKPFSIRELLARVRAVVRRVGGLAPAPELIVFDDLEIEGPRREVRRAGQPLKVTRKEFDLLFLLAANPGVTFTRTPLLEGVWDFAWDGDTNTVTVHVRRLREKIEDDPSDPKHLVTVWGVGYRFEP